MTLTAFNRARREAAERQRRQAVIVTPKPEPPAPTAEQLAAEAAEAYARQVATLKKDELVVLAEQRGIDTAGLLKAQLVEALVTIGPPAKPADEDGQQDPPTTPESE